MKKDEGMDKRVTDLMYVKGDLLTNKELLIAAMQHAEDIEAPWFGVAISNDGAVPEYIINPLPNFADKRAYYDKAYDDELRLKAAPKILIMAFAYGSTMEEIELKLR